MLNPVNKLLKAVRSAGESNLGKLETRLLSRYTTPAFAPVFIVGPPRSGTTLIYQALVCRYRAAYFCNLANRFSTSPALVTRLLARTVGMNPPLSFESKYGETGNLRSPAQGNKIWGRWFPGPQRFFTAGELTEQAVLDMQKTVACIESDIQAPFINKSIGHAVRIQALIRAFPTAIFLRVRRNPQQVVESILCGRREYFGDEKSWFSVRPSNYEQIRDLPPVEQICHQFASIERDFDRDVQAIGNVRVFEISYENFCAGPHDALGHFGDFYCGLTGHQLVIRHGIPDSFVVSLRSRVSDEERETIRAELQHIEAASTSRTGTGAMAQPSISD